MKEEARSLLNVGRLRRPAEAWETPRGAEEPAEEDEVYWHTARYGLCTRQPGMKDLTLLRAVPGQGRALQGWGIAAGAPHSPAQRVRSSSVVHP